MMMRKELPLADLSYAELLELSEKLQKLLHERRDAERMQVRNQIESLARNSGFSLEDLLGRNGRRGGARKPKYVNPENMSETWTGRGRKPKWLLAKIKKGANLSDFSV
jgi:DNA-binding protein H-NS